MPIALPLVHFKSACLSRLLLLSACALACAWPPSALADSLSWRDGLKEGERRLQRKELDLALACFRQALRAVKRDKSSKPDDIALCMEKLAAVLQMEDITDEAVPLYRRALKILMHAHGGSSTAVLPDLLALGEIFESEGQFKSASKLYTEAVDMAAKDPAATSLSLADCKYHLARVTFKNGQPQPAEALYRSTLALIMAQKSLPSTQLLQEVISDYTDLLEKTYGPGKALPSDMRAELLKDRLAALPQKQGVVGSSFEKQVTLRFANEAFAKIPAGELPQNGPGDSAVGPGHEPFLAIDLSLSAASALPATADNVASGSSGASVSVDGIGQQRIQFYQRMVAVDLKTLGPEHPSVARDLSGLGAVYMAAGRYDDAKILFMRALKIYEKVYGGDALLAKRTRTILELICDDQSAEESGTTAGTNFVPDLPAIPVEAQKVDIAIALDYLASLCYSLGKIEDAERIYSWSVADTYRATGEQSLLLAAGLKDYARVLRSAGKVPRAEILEGEARAIMRRVLSQQAIGSFQ